MRKGVKRNNLKLRSYPFDWIFSSPNNVINCIEDNFEKFLNKSYYINIGDTQCGHTFYNSQMWQHHNPLIIENDYNYYVRCVERFKLLLNSIELKLFTMIFINGEYHNLNENIKNNIITFNEQFKKYTTNYRLLIIIHLPNQESIHHTFTSIDNIDFIELYTISLSNGVAFIDDNDNI